MLITDGKRIVKIETRVWEGKNYSPDFSNDLFDDIGLCPYDYEKEAHIVEDIEYVIKQAYDWKNSVGDYCYDEPNENNAVFIEEL